MWLVRGLLSPARQSFSAPEHVARQLADPHHAQACEYLQAIPRNSIPQTFPPIMRDKHVLGNFFFQSSIFFFCVAENTAGRCCLTTGFGLPPAD